jgi:DNA mismatch endonuclease, patch repair protein
MKNHPVVKGFMRDGRSPIPAKVETSRVMSANRAKNTKPELMLRKAIWSMGIRGYRLHWKKAPGRPDISFPGKRVAIFVNGCFWHRCPLCKLPIPKSNSTFWNDKFKKNIERDKLKISLLKRSGWKVLVVWECEIRDNLKACADELNLYLNNQPK